MSKYVYPRGWNDLSTSVVIAGIISFVNIEQPDQTKMLVNIVQPFIHCTFQFNQFNRNKAIDKNDDINVSRLIHIQNVNVLIFSHGGYDTDLTIVF